MCTSIILHEGQGDYSHGSLIEGWPPGLLHTDRGGSRAIESQEVQMPAIGRLQCLYALKGMRNMAKAPTVPTTILLATWYR